MAHQARLLVEAAEEATGALILNAIQGSPLAHGQMFLATTIWVRLVLLGIRIRIRRREAPALLEPEVLRHWKTSLCLSGR